jgi:SAM-dependent methyltransferase
VRKGLRVTRAADFEWDQVDRGVDPIEFVSYLDAVMGVEAVRAIKRHTFTLMNIRPGHAVLDVGCGAGDDLRSLAELVGPTGRVVGVDNSETMAHEARTCTHGLPVECYTLEMPSISNLLPTRSTAAELKGSFSMWRIHSRHSPS